MSLLLLWSLRSAGVIGVAFLAALAMRRRSAAARNLVFRIALAVAWILPLAGLYAPRIAVALPERAPVVASSLPSTVPNPEPQADPMPGADLSQLPMVEYRTPTSTTSLDPSVLAFPTYLLGAGALLLRWLVGVVRLRRLARRGTPIDGDPRVLRGEIGVPATYGRTILLPRASSEWPAARVQAAVLHERAHLHRGDWAWQTAAGLFAAAHWFNPAAWLLLRLLRDSAEAAADDAAIAAMRPSDYARELLAVAQSADKAGPALAMARRGGVQDRIVGVLATRDRTRPTRRAGVALAGVLALVGLALAGVQKAERPTGSSDPTRLAPLSKGRALTLVAVRDLVDGKLRDWAPDGGSAPADLSRYLSPSPSSVSSTDDEKWKSYRFVVALEDDPRNDPSVTLDPTPNGSWASITHDVSGESRLRAYEFATSFERGRTVGDLRFGVASGPWRPLKGLDFTQEKFPDAPGPTRVFVQLKDLATRGKNWRILAYDAEGRPQRASSASGSDSIRYPGRFYTDFDARQPVARVVLQTRDYRWVKFPGVRLQPNQVERSGERPRLIGIVETTLRGVQKWRPDGGALRGFDAPNMSPPIPAMTKPARGLRFFFDVDASNDHPSRTPPKFPDWIPPAGSVRVWSVGGGHALVYADIVVSTATVETIDVGYGGKTFSNVHLKPSSGVASPVAFAAEASRPFGARRTAELLFVADNASGASWRPDGTPLPGRKPQPEPPSHPGSRRLSFGIRVVGPSFQRSYWEGMAQLKNGEGHGSVLGYPDQLSETGGARSRVAGFDAELPNDVAMGDVRFEITEGPSRTEIRTADVRTVWSRSASPNGSTVTATFPKAIAISPDRKGEAVAFDAQGKPIRFNGDLPRNVSPRRSFTFRMSRPERIARWEIRSRLSSRVVFHNVAFASR